MQVVSGPVQGVYTLFSIEDSRPMRMAPFFLQHELIGLNVPVYYWVLAGCLMLVAIAFFIYLDSINILRRHQMSLAIVLLFLIYPTDYTRMWLNHFHNTSAFLLFVLAVVILDRYIRGEGRFLLILSGVLAFFSLLIYEAHLGLCLLIAAIFFLQTDRDFSRRFSSSMMLVVVCLIVGVWRTVGQSSMGIQSYGMESITTDPRTLLSRLLLGYKITLGWGWSTPVNNSLPWIGSSNVFSLLILVVFILMIWLGYRGVEQFADSRHFNESKTESRTTGLKRYVVMGLIGLITIAAGYIPVITVYLPNLSDYGSRFNQHAAVGGALVIASAIMIGTIMIGSSSKTQARLFWIAIGVLVAMGAYTQHLVNREHLASWEEQKSIWNQIFTIIPDFKDGTTVLLVLPGYEDAVGYQNWKRLPFAGEWDIQSGLQLMYDNASLNGTLWYPDIFIEPESMIVRHGIVHNETGEITPFESVVALRFNRETGFLELMSQIPYEENGSVSFFATCHDCILSHGLNVPLRRLVQ